MTLDSSDNPPSPLPSARAILLLAGAGRRLGDLTDDRPKCLVHVAGIPILEHALSALEACGIREVTAVAGYRSEQVRDYVDRREGSARVEFVENPDFDSTNTAYSLHLAAHRMDGPCLLLEGDILVEKAGLEHVLTHGDRRDSLWAGVPVKPGRAEGILLSRDPEHRIARVARVRTSDPCPDGLEFKCAGIQRLSGELSRAFRSALDDAVKAGERRVFADLVLARILDRYPMQIVSLDGFRWAEIDTRDDLHRADSRFSEARLQVTSDGAA